MRAITYHRYGGPEVLELVDIERPAPEPDQVLIEVAASSLNPFDWHFMTGTPWMVRIVGGLRRPKVTTLGRDLAGRVVAVGSEVSELTVGDRVVGGGNGAMAEYAVARPKSLAVLPDKVGDAEAATLPIAGATAYQALVETGGLTSGQTVLINGAAGGVGTMAVQIAVALGARVTGVCSTRNVEMVRSLGAEHVIDYTTTDVVDEGRRFDLVLDNVGNRSARDLMKLIEADGTVVATSGPKKNRLVGPLINGLGKKLRFVVARRRFTQMTARIDAATMATLVDMCAAGRLAPAVEKQIGLDDVATEMEYLATGHVRAKIVVDVTDTLETATLIASSTTA